MYILEGERSEVRRYTLMPSMRMHWSGLCWRQYKERVVSPCLCLCETSTSNGNSALALLHTTYPAPSSYFMPLSPLSASTRTHTKKVQRHIIWLCALLTSRRFPPSHIRQSNRQLQPKQAIITTPRAASSQLLLQLHNLLVSYLCLLPAAAAAAGTTTQGKRPHSEQWKNCSVAFLEAEEGEEEEEEEEKGEAEGGMEVGEEEAAEKLVETEEEEGEEGEEEEDGDLREEGGQQQGEEEDEAQQQEQEEDEDQEVLEGSSRLRE